MLTAIALVMSLKRWPRLIDERILGEVAAVCGKDQFDDDMDYFARAGAPLSEEMQHLYLLSRKLYSRTLILKYLTALSKSR